MPYYVYILASGRHGTLYIGVTNDLVRRIYEHRTNAVDGFTKKYGVHHLVDFEVFDYGQAAIQRERTVKHWRRDWKISLIEQSGLARSLRRYCTLTDGCAGQARA